MAVEFNFYLSDDDFNKLYAIKEQQGKNNMTGNEFARELLENEIYRLHPGRVVQEEEEY